MEITPPYLVFSTTPVGTKLLDRYQTIGAVLFALPLLARMRTVDKVEFMGGPLFPEEALRVANLLREPPGAFATGVVRSV